MEKEEVRIIQIFLGIVLIVFLIIMIFLFTSVSAGREPGLVISNSYNSYVYADRDYQEIYYEPERKHRDKYRGHLGYDSRGEHKRVKGVFGNYIDIYNVYVKNKERVGGYFTVRFYFYDYYGGEDTEMMTYYIGPLKEKTFSYRDISHRGHDYYGWDYKVTSESRRPETKCRSYYRDDYICDYIYYP